MSWGDSTPSASGGVRLTEAYRTSPKGQAEAARRAAEVIEKQAKVAGLFAVELPLLERDDHRAALRWVRALSDVADDAEVKVNWQTAISALERLGYGRNRNTVPNGASESVAARFQAWLRSDTTEMAHYIMGQVLDCMYMNMPPHPCVAKFVEEWMDRE